LQQALKALPADYRTAILLCDLEQRSYQEIAEAMHCAIGTVRSRIHRARVMLRKRLEVENPSSHSRRHTAYRREPASAPDTGVAPPAPVLAAA
ncbi:MAG TPA: sigma factor-like helix-turn-helix DNA-binding protein, partial [Chthonomonadaceae bacterium]|nr:sigma factor-like helix-turn-helix DNA-binding protein [Chthonomonadaceae bacterium]